MTEQDETQLQRRVRELKTLYGIGKAVTSLLDLERLLNRIVEAAVFLSGAEEGFLLLVDGETGELYMRAGKGLGERYARGFRVKVDDSIAGQVVKTGKPILFGSTKEKVKVKTGYLVKSLLNVPLKVGDKVIGVLSVDNATSGKAFTDNDIFLLSALADYAAIAIENARLYNETEKEAKKLAEALQSQKIESSAAIRAEEIDWLVQKLEAQRREVEASYKETEQLAQTLREQAKTMDALAGMMLSQKVEISEFNRRLRVQREGVGEMYPLPPGPTVALIEGADQSRLVEVDFSTLQTALDGLNEGIIVGDAGGDVMLANAAAGLILRLTNGVLPGQRIKALCQDGRWEKNVDSLRSSLLWPREREGHEDEETRSLEMTLRVDQQVIRANMSLLPDRAGNWAGMVIILRDVTQESKAQRLRDELGLSISQEMRTPLTSITSYTELVLGESVGLIGRTQRKFLERIKSSVDRIDAILDELIDIRAITAQGTEGTLLSADIGEIIKEAIVAHRSQLAEKDIFIELDISDDLPRVEADPQGISQVVADLLNNACQATSASSTITVRARMYEEEDWAEDMSSHLIVSISDSGPGVAPEEQGKIFDRFYWTKHRSVTGLGEAGVGLPVVKALLEAYGGRIWVDSKPEEGSTFSFILPIINRHQEQT
jgi:signal transduction histidine kinase/putative methionine-R-sulfoxide reductase with GAF domain